MTHITENELTRRMLTQVLEKLQDLEAQIAEYQKTVKVHEQSKHPFRSKGKRTVSIQKTLIKDRYK